MKREREREGERERVCTLSLKNCGFEMPQIEIMYVESINFV